MSEFKLGDLVHIGHGFSTDKGKYREYCGPYQIFRIIRVNNHEERKPVPYRKSYSLGHLINNRDLNQFFYAHEIKKISVISYIRLKNKGII